MSVVLYFCCYHVSDCLAFQEAMNIVHISKEDQDNVFTMVSAVLWLGDVSFTVIDNENHVEIVVDEGKGKYLCFHSIML